MAHFIVVAAAALLGGALFLLAGRRSAPDGARRIGPYLLGDKIGQGAMGEVYRARHERLDRWCAIKLLSGPVSAHTLERFEREARATASIEHANTVAIHDFGRTPDGGAYYAMELCEGVTLRELAETEGPLASRRVVEIVKQLAAALAAAHRAGIVHRDIKPDNVIVCQKDDGSELVKLVDFGLAKHVGEGEDPNLLVGTPLFMSPEAIAAPNSVSARSDIYALGAVAYYLLTGEPVFIGDTLVDVCGQHLYAKPRAPSRVSGRPIAPELERLVLDCLAKNPLERPASAAEVAARLVPPAPARFVPAWASGESTRIAA
jgi:serine/threonine-protein kinase